VLLAHHIWFFIKENRDMEIEAVGELLARLRSEVAQHHNILVHSEHRNIWHLMDLSTDADHVMPGTPQPYGINRIFFDVFRRMRRGSRVSFREFLKAVCPCASDARLRLFDFWHLQVHWSQEEASSKTIRRWRKHFESTKPASELQKLNKANTEEVIREHIVTIDDLVVAGVVTNEVAEEVMASMRITRDAELGEADFLQAFCRSGQSMGTSFEEMMRTKFGRLAAGLQKLRTIDDGRGGSKRTSSKRTSSKESVHADEGGFPLEELVGCNDLMSVFDFMSSFDDKAHLGEAVCPAQSTATTATPRSSLAW